MSNNSANRPRIAFASLSDEGKQKALALVQPDYTTADNDLKAQIMAHWMTITVEEYGFMDDNSGRS